MFLIESFLDFDHYHVTEMFIAVIELFSDTVKMQ